MSLEEQFDEVVRIATEATSTHTGMAEVVRYLATEAAEYISPLERVNFEEDVSQLSAQLQNLIREEPPPTNLNAFYFGLFDGSDEDGNEGLGYYVSGIVGYSPDDSDTLCDPAWWPESRYLASEALNAVKSAELAARNAGDASSSDLLGYAGQLGTALILTKFAAGVLGQYTRCVVGFDSGDFAEIIAATLPSG